VPRGQEARRRFSLAENKKRKSGFFYNNKKNIFHLLVGPLSPHHHLLKPKKGMEEKAKGASAAEAG
jgi:hypothetical protein